MSGDDEESLFKSKHYYDLDEAYDDVGLHLHTKDKAVAAAKLAGKSLFNVGVFAGKLGVGILKQVPHALAQQASHQLRNNPNLTDDQREQCRDMITRSDDLRRQETEDKIKKKQEKERAKREL